jgi:hypothetical protein
VRTEKGEVVAVQIPARNTSEYAGEYARSIDPGRILEIFTDCCRIALSSKNPETAHKRFSLAIETYHQFMSMGPPTDVANEVRQAMQHLVEVFPEQVVANEALGLRERANKLKTPRKQLDLLYRARDTVQSGLTEHPVSSLLQTAAADLRAEIARSEASAT